MVWFYGGGLFSGESEDYDGGKLASRGDVIVVTLNYRFGALGFLSHPALNQEGHAAVNYGIMDQQFALRWVTDNIAGFSGDPYNLRFLVSPAAAPASWPICNRFCRVAV